MSELRLDGFDYLELRQREGLVRLDDRFLDTLGGEDPALLARLLEYRDADRRFTTLEVSELILAVARHLETFLAGVFGIDDERRAAQ